MQELRTPVTLKREQFEAIKLMIRVNDFLANKRMPTDQELDKYIIDNYNGKVAIECIGEDFITYGVFSGHIFIKDMVCHGNGWTLLNNLIQKSEAEIKPLRCMVHAWNEQQMQIMEKRFDFKRIGLVGNQYYMEREI